MARKNGFTLLEMLIVLMVVSVLAALAVPSIERISQAKEEAHLIEQLTNDLLYAQHYALTQRKAVVVVFHNGQGRYRITENYVLGRLLLERELPSPWIFEMATLQSPLTFLANGNVNKSGTMFLRNGKGAYKIVFLLGKGRFYVQKL